MVMIIDGEVVPDSDPRAQKRRVELQRAAQGGGSVPVAAVSSIGSGSSRGPQPSPATSQMPAFGQPAVGRGVINTAPIFDYSQPLLRFVPAQPGTSLMGLPDAELYGLRIPTKYIAIVVVAVLIMGWRGLLVGVLVMMYLMSNSMGVRSPISVSTPPPPGPRTLSHQPPSQGGVPAGGAPANPADALQGYFARGPASRSTVQPLQPANKFGGGGKGHRLGTRDD